MTKYLITTDSGCDLPLSFLKEKGIIPLAMKYEIDGQIFLDTMKSEDCNAFYERMKEGAAPKTSQINVGEFLEFWRPMLAEKLPILHISLSGGISGSYSNALTARDMLKEEYPDSEILVVDSTLASAGFGMLVLRAAEMRDEGATPDECVAWLEANKGRINPYYTTGELKYLLRGGRISRVSAIAGSLLNINPIMRMDISGHLRVQDKVRGSKATLKRIYSIVEELVQSPETQVLFISHSDDLERAKIIGHELQKQCGFKDVFYTCIGAIIGAHTGPGLTSVFFYGLPRTE